MHNRRWFRVQSIGEVRRTYDHDSGESADPAEPVLLVIDERWEAGLLGLEEFSHLVVLFWLDRAARRRIAGRPAPAEGRAEFPPIGFFATRTPRRPNPIGIACPRLLNREGRNILVTGIDAWDRTPIIDIKGYFPRDEQRPDAAVPNWLTELWRLHDLERR